MKETALKILTASLMVLAVVSVASASDWCGENGLIRLSFSEGEELQPVFNVEPNGTGVTTIDLYAYISDFDLVEKNGEAFMGIGAVEFNLIIEGAEGFITSQVFSMANRSVGRRPGEVMVGLDPGLTVKTGIAQVVHWEILFQGTPENVVFRLDRENLLSCIRSEECQECRPYAMYTGNSTSRQLGSLFGAGYVPAYLNFKGEPDLEPLRGDQTWQEVGLYKKR